MTRVVLVLAACGGLAVNMTTAQPPADDSGLLLDAITFIVGPDGGKWDVFANRWPADYGKAGPFAYIRPVSLAKSNGPAYDPATGSIKFDLLLGDPTPAETLAAAGRVLNAFPAEVRQQVLPAQVNLSPAPLAGYEVRLAVSGRRVTLDRQDTVLSGTTRLQMAVPVPDEAVRKVLAAGQPANVEFVGLYRARQSVVDEARVTHTVAATSKAFEEFFGKPADPVYYVTRRAKAELAAAIQQTINTEFRTSDAARVPFLQEQVKRSLDALRPATLDELRETRASLIAYGPEQVRAEIKPNRIAKLVTRDITHDKLFDEVAKTWDRMYQELAKLEDEQQFFDKVCEYVETEKKGGGDFDGGSFLGWKLPSGHGDGGLWKREGSEKLSESKMKRVREYMQMHKDAGMNRQTRFKDYYRDITGRQEIDRTEVKALDVYRVENAAVVQSLTEEFRIVVNKGTITRPHLTPLALAGDDFLTDQQRFDALLRRSEQDQFSDQFMKSVRAGLGSRLDKIEAREWKVSGSETGNFGDGESPGWPGGWREYKPAKGLVERERMSAPINFDRGFTERPYILLTFGDYAATADRGGTMRQVLNAVEVTKDSFRIQVGTWGPNQLGFGNVKWLAIGR